MRRVDPALPPQAPQQKPFYPDDKGLITLKGKWYNFTDKPREIDPNSEFRTFEMPANEDKRGVRSGKYEYIIAMAVEVFPKGGTRHYYNMFYGKDYLRRQINSGRLTVAAALSLDPGFSYELMCHITLKNPPADVVEGLLIQSDVEEVATVKDFLYEKGASERESETVVDDPIVPEEKTDPEKKKTRKPKGFKGKISKKRR